MDVETDPLGLQDPLDCRPTSMDLQNLLDYNASYEMNILPEDSYAICDFEQKWEIEQIEKPRKQRKTSDYNGNNEQNSVFGCRLKKVKKSREKKMIDVQNTNILSTKIRKKSRKKEKALNSKKQTSKKSCVTTECDEKPKLKVDRKKFKKKKNFDDSEKIEKLNFVRGKKNGQNGCGKSNRKHQCKVCQKTFIAMSHLNAHMNCHSDVKWNCDKCGKNFSCERSLTRHRETFPGEHWFPCQHCDMHFFRVENILKHLEIKHPKAFLEAKETGELILQSNEEENNMYSGKKIFICVKCLKLFYDFSELKSHKKNFHSYENFETIEKSGRANAEFENFPKYRCEICFKEFVSLEGFEYHMNNQHLEEAEKINKTKHTLSDKEKGQNFACKTCSQSFLTKSDYEVHVRSHSTTKNPNNHHCCICPRSFASSDGLKYHLATHTGERQYSCSQCSKKFIKKTHLYEHMATHSKIKCYKCSRCPRTFSTHSAYRKHIKLFPGPHSFPCTKCGKLFTKESMLEKHICVDLMHVTMAPEVKALLGEENKKSQTSDECNLVLDQNTENEDLLLKNSSKDNFTTKSHSCYKCFNVFPSLDQLQTHQYEHIGKQLYKCRFCLESFKRADDFSNHIRSHLGSSPYMCLKCNKKFISPLSLAMHAKKYPGEHSFTCSKCQRWFPTEKKLEKHECILQNAETFVCACESVFRNWNDFCDHAGSKPYKCCVCESKYSTLISLARHIKKHTGVKPFSCETCGKSFQAKTNYLNHLKMHEKSKEMQCEHCDFKSKSKKRLDFHLFRKHNIGSSTNSNLCPFCGIIFPYVSQMKKHMETEHGSEFISEESKEERKTSPVVLCTLCGKFLSNKYMLANHMKKIHNPDPSKSTPEFQCEVCKEKFQSKIRLQKHMSVHESPGLRTCKICSREFFFVKDLKRHMKRHDTAKPFFCPKCGKNFKVSVSLKYHSSICGNEAENFFLQNPDGRTKQINFPSNILTSESNIYYGCIDPLSKKNFTYPVFTSCQKWNQ